MSKPFEEWTVLPHGSLTKLDDNLMTVTGSLKMPVGEFQRRMTIVRLRTGELIIYSAIALDEPQMAELEAFGTPTYLVVPGDIHRMDAKAWKKRYPRILVIAPAGARSKVEKVVPVDATGVVFQDPAVRLFAVPGTQEHEAALTVESASGTTLILNDIIFNGSNQPGFRGWLLRLMGITGKEPHIPGLIKRLAIKDQGALRSQLESWSHLPNLNRIVVSHGNIINQNPTQVLSRIANNLSAS